MVSSQSSSIRGFGDFVQSNEKSDGGNSSHNTNRDHNENDVASARG